MDYKIPDYILNQIPRKVVSAVIACKFEWPSRPLHNEGNPWGYTLKERADCVIETDDGRVVPVYESDIGAGNYLGRILTVDMYNSAKVFGVLESEFQHACKLLKADQTCACKGG